jgi:hypothetical protein
MSEKSQWIQWILIKFQMGLAENSVSANDKLNENCLWILREEWRFCVTYVLFDAFSGVFSTV